MELFTITDFFIDPFVAAKILPKWTTNFYPLTIWKAALQDETGYDYLIHLLVYTVVLFLLIIFLESTIPGRIFHSMFTCMCNVKYKKSSETDSAVSREQTMVSNLIKDPDSAQDVLLASGLRRWYGITRPKPAVRGVNFRVLPGECFGLLGVNGAGKSTTFNMLTAQIACSSGDAVLNKSHLANWWPNKYLSQMSYCPQSSGIIPELEGKEFLQLFARLRGFRECQVDAAVVLWIKLLDLEECAGRRCGRYSGGTERKLSAAAAFLWDASVVMLDEPTSGVDPVARRSIWKAVTTAQDAGKSVVLTSHSMDECEALCSRLAIMVDGEFRCIGETSTIKKRYGGGFSLQLKVAASQESEMKTFQDAVVASLGKGCRLTDRHCSILHYHIMDNTTNWKTLFKTLEDLKKRFSLLESYMASETNLEEIFLTFAGRRSCPAEYVHCVEIT